MVDFSRATAGQLRRAGIEPGVGLDDDETDATTGFAALAAGTYRAAGFRVSPSGTADAATTGFEIIAHATDAPSIEEYAVAFTRGDWMPDTTS